MSPSPLTPAAEAEARPVEASERLPLLDVLRGFALGGVFVSNVYVWFSGRSFLPKERLAALMASPVEAAIQHFSRIFVYGKFFSLLALLFGLGFSLQLMRAEARGVPLVPLYVRRMGVLLLIGLAHALTLWYGDVLYTYAIAGCLLLLFRKQSDGQRLAWALALILLSPLLVLGLMQLWPVLTGVPDTALENARTAQELYASLLSAFEDNSYLDAMRANIYYYYTSRLNRPATLMFIAVTLGCFLLGYHAGRLGLFQDVPAHAARLRRLLLWGLGAGVLGSGLSPLARALWDQEWLREQLWWPPLISTVFELGVLGTSIVYATGLALLFQRPGWQRRLSVLAPVGRMALTNYLTQSALGIVFFYGFGLGLVGKLGSAACIALTLALFAVQVLLSHLWLARFHLGPAEWLWRSMTYGKAQPMRRHPRPGPGVAPA